MRRISLLLVTMLTLSAVTARAAGVNLGWDDCPGGASYASNQAFACDTDEGSHTLVGSYVAPAGIVKLSANEFSIDIQSSGEAVPAWWSFRPGACRMGSLSGDFNFSGNSGCYDYWQGDAIGALHPDVPVGRGARVRGLVALPSTSPLITSIAEGTHVYSFKVVLNHAKTVGSCGGCADEACIVLSSIKLNQPPPYSMPVLTDPVTSQRVTWQGADACDILGRATPATRQSWGSIKALYR